MSEDDQRTRAEKPGLVPSRPRERDEEPVRLDGQTEPGGERPSLSGDSALPDDGEPRSPAALGGDDIATRSGVSEAPPEPDR